MRTDTDLSHGTLIAPYGDTDFSFHAAYGTICVHPFYPRRHMRFEGGFSVSLSRDTVFLLLVPGLMGQFAVKHEPVFEALVILCYLWFYVL
jgi:hypothetical protein